MFLGREMAGIYLWSDSFGGRSFEDHKYFGAVKWPVFYLWSDSFGRSSFEDYKCLFLGCEMASILFV